MCVKEERKKREVVGTGTRVQQYEQTSVSILSECIIFYLDVSTAC